MAEPNGSELQQIAQLIESGKVRPHVSATFELAEVARAHELLERGGVRGKVVLEMKRAG